MNSDIKKDVTSKWFNPYYKWEYCEPRNNIDQNQLEESVSMSPSAYKLDYLLNQVLQIDVEIKVDRDDLIIKLYNKKSPLSDDLKGHENVYQLFYCKKYVLLPDMLPDKISIIVKEKIITIEIPRITKSGIKEKKTNSIISFKENFYG